MGCLVLRSEIIYFAEQSTATYFASLLCVFLMGLLRRGCLQFRREFRRANVMGCANNAALNSTKPALASALVTGGEVCADISEPSQRATPPRPFLRLPVAISTIPGMLVFCDAAVFFIGTVISFLNMLIVMTFNPGLLVALAAGETLGMAALESKTHENTHSGDTSGAATSEAVSC